ncbi:unnamed protein product [Rotaria sordida]|uniref:Uncharacterized protein n=1 Tax=Rotaria sordida TaxID=392033 RepID=A0A814Y1H5_9BILA|nr:unnamed protein product [Rotaria sordida]CAF1503400.1 unnamed protein product [Rotaria sordida]
MLTYWHKLGWLNDDCHHTSRADLQPKIEIAIQIYRTANRLLFDKVEFQLELDACIRWCSLLQEQNDLKIYLNAYLAEAYAFVS